MSLRAVIFFHTLTKQTEKVAEAIAKGMTSSDADVRLQNLVSSPNPQNLDVDFIGIGIPVHMWGMPLAFKKLWEAHKVPKEVPVFLFITHGPEAGNTFFHFAKYIRNCGHQIFSHFQLTCFDNYPPFVKYKIFQGHPDSDDLKKCEQYGSMLTSEFVEFRSGKKSESSFVRKWNLLELNQIVVSRIGGFLNKNILLVRKYVSKKCNRCQKCINVCPSGSIHLDPVIHHDEKCTGCCGCALVCPTGAITIPRTKLVIFYFRTMLASYYGKLLRK